MLTKEIINKLFEYKNGKLYRKVDDNSTKVAKEIGTIVGRSQHSKGYYGTTYEGKRVYLHQIVYLMFNDDITGRIRFLDRNTLNYSIENLKACSTSEILFTAKTRCDNISGYRGVSWCKNRNKWVAWIGKDKKKTWLGYFDDKESAYAKYVASSIEMYGEENV